MKTIGGALELPSPPAYTPLLHTGRWMHTVSLKFCIWEVFNQRPIVFPPRWPDVHRRSSGGLRQLRRCASPRQRPAFHWGVRGIAFLRRAHTVLCVERQHYSILNRLFIHNRLFRTTTWLDGNQARRRRCRRTGTKTDTPILSHVGCLLVADVLMHRCSDVYLHRPCFSQFHQRFCYVHNAFISRRSTAYVIMWYFTVNLIETFLSSTTSTVSLAYEKYLE